MRRGEVFVRDVYMRRSCYAMIQGDGWSRVYDPRRWLVLVILFRLYYYYFGLQCRSFRVWLVLDNGCILS